MDGEQLHQLIHRYESATFTVNRRLSALIRELMPGGLTADQYGILRYIQDRQRCTSSELADMFCVGKSSITAIITRLFDKELIRRMPDEKDRRVIYLQLTEKGAGVATEMEIKIQQLLARYISHFEEQEAETFIRTYEKLAKVLTEH